MIRRDAFSGDLDERHFVDRSSKGDEFCSALQVFPKQPWGLLRVFAILVSFMQSRLFLLLHVTEELLSEMYGYKTQLEQLCFRSPSQSCDIWVDWTNGEMWMHEATIFCVRRFFHNHHFDISLFRGQEIPWNTPSRVESYLTVWWLHPRRKLEAISAIRCVWPPVLPIEDAKLLQGRHIVCTVVILWAGPNKNIASAFWSTHYFFRSW